MAFEDGPYVQVACFCMMAIKDETGSISLIRVIDTFNTYAQGENPPADMPAIQGNLKLVLMLKSGTARGRYEIKLTPELPDGSTLDPYYFTVHFTGEEQGNNILVDLTFTFTIEGLYMFIVHLDDELLTRIPLRVKYNRIVTPRSSSQPALPPPG